MRYLCALTAALSIAACGGEASTAPVPLVGTWTLSTVNGKRLPFITSQVGSISGSEIVSGSLTFGTAGDYTLELDYQTSRDGVVSSTTSIDSGAYTVESADRVKLTNFPLQVPAFVEVPAVVVSATISGSSLSYDAGPAYVFRKR